MSTATLLYFDGTALRAVANGHQTLLSQLMNLSQGLLLRLREHRVWNVCQSCTGKPSLHCTASCAWNVGPAHDAGVVIIAHKPGMHHLHVLALA